MTQLVESELSPVVSYSVSGNVAIVRIDNPPVNASSAQVRAGLLAGLVRAESDQQISAVVLIGTGNFVSGSDLSEFSDTTLPEPQLPTVISAIEKLRIPVIAALSGATLGGGLELALGCDYRIAQSGTVVGLPETSLGMIPGAGGTQRTLRLLGPAAATKLICSAQRLKLTVSQPSALVDEIVDDGLLEAALRLAQKVSEKRILIDEPVPAEDPEIFASEAKLAIAKSKGRPHIISAVGAIFAGISLDARSALRHERSEFTRLRNGREAGALRHQFFAQRAVAKAHRPPAGVAVQRISIVGAGTMGMGIARAFAEAGISAVVYDTNAQAAQNSLEKTLSDINREVLKGRLAESQAKKIGENLRVVANFEQLAGSQLYLEAVFEDIDIKKEVLGKLEAIAEGAILATNTSYLDIDLLAQSLRLPQNLIGMHFFSPAFRTKVVEIIRAEATGQDASDTVFAAVKALGKAGIPARVCDGFIGNRIYNAYRRQCELMLEEGALPQQIDQALTDFGFAMGPFAVADMSGLDIAWRMRRSKDETRDPRERYPIAADQLCELGRLGQKTSAGWYRYAESSRRGEIDDSVTSLIVAASATQGLSRKSFSDEQIVRRVMLSMANEASLLLAEGIAERASDIDLMLVLGYGFPAYRGGISYWVSGEPMETLESEQRKLAEITGHGFVAGDLSIMRG